jgi:Ca-activated chloride channel family protein
MHDGQPVISKLDGESLRKIALATEGAYIPAGTSALELDAIMESHARPIVRAAADSAVREIPAERFPWMVLASLVLLLGALWLGAGAGGKR